MSNAETSNEMPPRPTNDEIAQVIRQGRIALQALSPGEYAVLQIGNRIVDTTHSVVGKFVKDEERLEKAYGSIVDLYGIVIPGYARVLHKFSDAMDKARGL